MMRSASRLATHQLREHKRPVIDRQESGDALLSLADELFDVAQLLVGSPQLRRSLGDPASAADRRATLIGGLLEGKVSPSTREITEAVVRQRWSSPWDMTDALEVAGDDALFEAADRERVLDQIVDELFRFERILDSHSELAVLLDEKPTDASRRVGLLHTVLDDRAHPITTALLANAVRSQRKHTLSLAIDNLLEEAAARQSQSMARVISATDLTAQQCSQLTETLSDLYGRPISIRTAVAPAIKGGLIIRIGDEVIDGSINARLSSAHLALVAQAERQPIESRTRQGKQY
jgi:F-type H+-transporting ATPase subunit delta